MAISGLSTDYSGRKVDLHIMQGVKAPNATAINLGFGKISNYCSGVQKLIQRYMIMLLTEIGSQEEYPTFGSNFITRLTSTSNNYNRTDLQHIFAFANNKVSTEIIAYQVANTLPLDEQLNVARLINIETTPTGGVALKIQIETATNGAVQFIVPLPN